MAASEEQRQECLDYIDKFQKHVTTQTPEWQLTHAIESTLSSWLDGTRDSLSESPADEDVLDEAQRLITDMKKRIWSGDEQAS